MASVPSSSAESWDGLSARLKGATALLTGLSCVAVLFSIAASQTLLAAALLSLFLSRRSLEFPPRLAVPLLGFAGWTLLAVAFSSAPASGLPQVRKLFVFFTVLLVANAFQRQKQIRWALHGMALAAAAASVYGLAQFAARYMELRRQALPFYENYVLHQITGFMSHWMTFAGQLMLMLFLLCAVLLFAERTQAKRWGWLGVALVGTALLAAFTRGIWLGTLAGLTYLLASYRRWMLGLIPAALLVFYLISPVWLQRRGSSIFQPEGDTSTLSRVVMFRTGLGMIAAHPWFGVGPERVAVEFARYHPQGADLPPAWYGHLHNSFLQVAAERGIPCLLLLLWIFFEVLRDNVRRARNATPNARALSIAAVAATIGMMVSGLFEHNFGDSEVLMLYLILISVPFAWEQTERRQTPETPRSID